MKNIRGDLIPSRKITKPQTFQLLASGTNLKAIKRRLPAPAIEANTRPKSVGTVLEAKTIDEIPTPMGY